MGYSQPLICSDKLLYGITVVSLSVYDFLFVHKYVCVRIRK